MPHSPKPRLVIIHRRHKGDWYRWELRTRTGARIQSQTYRWTKEAAIEDAYQTAISILEALEDEEL